MIRVKICGITNEKDAIHALRCGADALGFVFAESPRRVSAGQAKKIIQAVGPFIAAVGVFVDEDPQKVLRVARECGLSAVQLHGEENPSYLNKLKPLKTIKAFRVDRGFDWRKIRAYAADAFLFDTKIEGKAGGTGQVFDWKILKRMKISRPLILSGGLNPRNVGKAVNMLAPYAVDASSGVESSPGKKDAKLVKEFIFNAKQN